MWFRRNFRRPPPLDESLTWIERKVSLSMGRGTCMRRVRGSREGAWRTPARLACAYASVEEPCRPSPGFRRGVGGDGHVGASTPEYPRLRLQRLHKGTRRDFLRQSTDLTLFLQDLLSKVDYHQVQRSYEGVKLANRCEIVTVSRRAARGGESRCPRTRSKVVATASLLFPVP